MPEINDTRAVMAAMDNEFLRSAKEVRVIPSAVPVSFRYIPYPETVNRCGSLQVTGLTPGTATAVHAIIHNRVAFDDAWKGGLSYQWGRVYSFQITLAKYDGDEGYRVLFPILYGENSDIDAIIGISRNPLHQAMYSDLGLSISQMTVTTYVYDPRILGWQVRPQRSQKLVNSEWVPCRTIPCSRQGPHRRRFRAAKNHGRVSHRRDQLPASSPRRLRERQ